MADFNPFDPRLRTNPYAVYKELREEAPVFWSPVMQIWVLTRYDDCLAVLRDHARFSSERTRATNRFVQQMEEYRQAAGPIGRTPTMLSLDPPAHTRMRNLVNKAFTPRVVERSRPRIQAIAASLLDGLADAAQPSLRPTPASRPPPAAGRRATTCSAPSSPPRSRATC